MTTNINIEKLKSDYERLRTGLKELAILNEIATTINSTQEVGKIIETIIHKCIKHFNVEQGNISLIKEPEVAVPLQTMIRQYDSDAGRIPFRMDQQLIGWMLTKKEPLIINDLTNDPRFSSLASETEYNSLMAVPMIHKGKIMGVLSLFNKHGNIEFSKEDLRLLSIIATESSQVLENARLLEEEKKLTHVQEELKIAALIQKNLLPAKIPEIRGYQVSAVNIPAKEIGGDYYDIIPLDEDKYAFCFGDVSGKGIPAGLLMSNIQATMRSLLLSEKSPEICVRKANKLIHATTTIDKYITFFLGILDVKGNSFVYCNAGHDLPLHLTNFELQELEKGGIPLGFLDDFEFTQSRFFFKENDILVIYTDGVTEAMNKDEEEFGLEPLKKIILNNKDNNTQDIQKAVLEQIKNHSKGFEQMDDITLIVLKRN
jgi:phosphoserine phosphatase RsbU/P